MSTPHTSNDLGELLDGHDPASGSDPVIDGTEADESDDWLTPSSRKSRPRRLLPTALAASSYFVQVAAVSKQDDAQALVDALKKKQYAAFTSNSSATDKFFHVQVGPFNDLKDAEATRAKLIGDGYNPILKK